MSENKKSRPDKEPEEPDYEVSVANVQGERFMSESRRSRPDKEPEEPDYEASAANVEACFESLQPNFPNNVHYIGDHDSRKSSNKDDS